MRYSSRAQLVPASEGRREHHPFVGRVYFHRSGQILGEVLDPVANRARLGRVAGAARIVMVLGIVATAIDHEFVQQHALHRPRPVWVAVILGGPALFLYGRIRLERVVFDRLSRRRVVGIITLVMLTVPLAFTAALTTFIAADAVLLGVAVADARHSAGRHRKYRHRLRE
ncbi:low temperature requirement protein A [Micromonospora purpureochromogenes]|uniref:low temperature requirement protein A n=1 Tax=Micromonospora purpureochromogenes TaxID=47872 RepID=UPI0033D240A7